MLSITKIPFRLRPCHQAWLLFPVGIKPRKRVPNYVCNSLFPTQLARSRRRSERSPYLEDNILLLLAHVAKRFFLRSLGECSCSRQQLHSGCVEPRVPPAKNHAWNRNSALPARLAQAVSLQKCWFCLHTACVSQAHPSASEWLLPMPLSASAARTLPWNKEASGFHCLCPCTPSPLHSLGRLSYLTSTIPD